MTKEQYAAYPRWMFSKKNMIKANFTPQNGVLSAKIGDTIKIEVELCESQGANVQHKLEIDEMSSGGHPIDHEQPIKSQEQQLNNIKKKLTYNYLVWSKTVKELAMVYGDDYLISYKLDVR